MSWRYEWTGTCARTRSVNVEMSFRAAVLVLVLSMVAACGNDPGDGSSTTDAGASVESTEQPGSTAPPGSGRTTPTTSVTTSLSSAKGEVPDEVLALVLADAADRSELAIQDLVVVREESVEWSDGSLGCPRPGHSYIESLTPGHWIEVVAGDRTFDYRTDDQGNFRLCDGLDGTTPSTVDR